TLDWCSVRCIFSHPDRQAYGERPTLWRVASFEAAIDRAETEAANYAQATLSRYTGLAQAYRLPAAPDQAVEIFSLIRLSALDSEQYLTRFFDTGTELQQSQFGAPALAPKAPLRSDERP